MQSRTAQVPVGGATITVRELRVSEIRNALEIDVEPSKPATHALQAPVLDLGRCVGWRRVAARLLRAAWVFCGLPESAEASPSVSEPMPALSPLMWEEALIARALTINGVAKAHLQAMCDVTDTQLFDALPSEIEALVKKAKELNSFFFNALFPDLSVLTAPKVEEASKLPPTAESDSKLPFQPLFDMATLMPGATPGPSSSPPSSN